MEVSLPQTMLQKLLDLLKLESFRPYQEIAIQSIIQDKKDAVICTHIDYHNQHESAALISLFHATSSVLPSVESYRNYQKLTQRGVQGYLSSLQQRVGISQLLLNSVGYLYTMRSERVFTPASSTTCSYPAFVYLSSLIMQGSILSQHFSMTYSHIFPDQKHPNLTYV